MRTTLDPDGHGGGGVRGERVLADLVVDGERLRVTTSAAPNTVRIYHRTTLACTLTGIGTVRVRPSWGATYLTDASARWRAIVEACTLAEVKNIDLPGADPFTGEHEAA